MSGTKGRIASGWVALGLSLGLLSLPPAALAFCHDQQLVRIAGGGGREAAAEPLRRVAIRWLGHATFLITSHGGTQVLMDPHNREDLPWHPVVPDVVTTSHRHAPHSNLAYARGNPLILHGLTEEGEWNLVRRVFRDFGIFNVPVYHDKSGGRQRGKNSIFVLSLDGVCVAHLGDLGHLLTPKQVQAMGKVDILLVPLAGGYISVDAEEARRVVDQVKPRIAIPMHFWGPEDAERFLAGFRRVRRLKGDTLRVAKGELPGETEAVLLSGGERGRGEGQ